MPKTARKKTTSTAVIPGGFIFVARKIRESELYLRKSPTWLKIFLHILLEVNYQDGIPRYGYKRSVGTFAYPEIGPILNITFDQWHGCLDWLRSAGMIRTERRPTFLLIKVLNYHTYQDASLYEQDRTTPKVTVAEARQQSRDQYVQETVKELWPLRDNKAAFSELCRAKMRKLSDLGKNKHNQSIVQEALEIIRYRRNNEK